MSSPPLSSLAKVPYQSFTEFVGDSRALVEMVHQSTRLSLGISDRALSNAAESGSGARPVHQIVEETRREVSEGFPLLHGQALVGLWGALEGCMRDIGAIRLKKASPKDLSRYLQKSKGSVKLADFLAIEQGENWYWLLDQLHDRDVADSRGAGQFEKFLRPIGLGGEVPPNIKNTLFKVNLLRNVIAHKGGRVDEQFNEAWPGYPVRQGGRIGVSHEQYVAGEAAMFLYSQNVTDRLFRAWGHPPPEWRALPWLDSSTDLVKMMEPAQEA